jgi:hypothetical protein
MSIKPGDVLAIRTGGWEAWWIRFGSGIQGKPNLSNHIAVTHHVDANGVMWAIEGRPGGVGWVDATQYLKSPGLLTNVDQPKTDLQRATVCDTMKALLGTPYDWQAIVVDGSEDVGIKVPDWSPDWKTGEVPGHVVCSSAADYAYFKAGLACPVHGREVQPSDWDAFILGKGWVHA